MNRQDRASFDAFAHEVADPLFRTAWFLAGDWYLAEDLVQETLARLYARWPIAVQSPVAFGRATLTRTFLSHRRLRRSGELPTELIPEQQVAPGDLALRMTLLRALQQLPKAERAVVVLRYLADRSVEEVATDLGRSAGTVRNQASRALGRLRAELGDSYYDLLDH